MAKKKPPRHQVGQLVLRDASVPVVPAAPPGRGPIVLEPGPRSWGIGQWLRDERGVPVYRIVQKDIKTASIAATLARQERQHG